MIIVYNSFLPNPLSQNNRPKVTMADEVITTNIHRDRLARLERTWKYDRGGTATSSREMWSEPIHGPSSRLQYNFSSMPAIYLKCCYTNYKHILS
jgi:hypothetical protein